MSNIAISRRQTLALGGAAVAAAGTGVGLPTTARGATAVGEQAPAFQRTKVGDATVTTILDGYLDILPEWWLNVSPEELQAELREAFLAPQRPVRISVNAYVIKTPDRTVAIDAGAQELFGPTAGRYGERVALAGIDPASIDTVVLTHMHPDHVGGLMTNGAATFPNAELIGQSVEHNYWTSDTERTRAPDIAKPWFDAVAEVTRTYGERLRLIDGEVEAVPGLTAVSLNGHTPGHVGYLLQSGDERLFFWADVTDQLALQLNAPERGLIFDIDPEAAVRARKKAIELAATERLLIAGSHVPFPSFGHVATDRGQYRFRPAEWEYEL